MQVVTELGIAAAARHDESSRDRPLPALFPGCICPCFRRPKYNVRDQPPGRSIEETGVTARRTKGASSYLWIGRALGRAFRRATESALFSLTCQRPYQRCSPRTFGDLLRILRTHPLHIIPGPRPMYRDQRKVTEYPGAIRAGEPELNTATRYGSACLEPDGEMPFANATAPSS